MDGQRSTLHPFYEAFEFEQGSSSGNSGIDPQLFWNNMPQNPLEYRNTPSYLLSSADSSIPYGSIAGQECASLSTCVSGGPSSSLHGINQGSQDENKTQNDRPSSLTGSRGGGQRMEENQSQASNTLSLENLGIDLNSNHVENVQPLPQISTFDVLPQNSGYNVQNVGLTSQVPESRLYPQPSNTVLMQPQLSSSSSGSPSAFESRACQFFPDNGGGRQHVSLGDRSMLHKRKSIEEVTGQPSASGSSSSFNQDVNLPQEELNTRIDIGTRTTMCDHHSLGNTTGNEEGFQRNTRMRINQPHLTYSSVPNMWAQGNIIRHSNNWSARQPSVPPILPYQTLEPRLIGNHASSHGQPHVSVIPGLSSNMLPFSGNATSTLRIGSSSNSLGISDERAVIEEANSWSPPRNNTVEHPVTVPPTNARHLEQSSVNEGSNNGNTIIYGLAIPSSQSGNSAGVYQLPGPNGVSHQHGQRLTEVDRRAVLSPISEARGQSINPPPHPAHSSVSQEPGPHQIPAVSRARQRPYIRSSALMARQNGAAPGIPLSVREATREGRIRTMSEIRNAFNLIRRLDNLMFEELLLFEQSLLLGAAADFHDHHRDMRLDVDNMSYEELLALGERIGNVNTGLGEEKIIKCLKQWKYANITSKPSSEVEPCCICREEYIEGEELGRLDCGHDFHTTCIKQWLTLKNLCPICKRTALKT